MPRQLNFAPEAVERVTLEGDEARALSPEGVEAGMRLATLLDLARPRRIDTGYLILPDGVKSVVPTSRGLVVTHQTPPRAWSFKWIAEGSPARWGPGTEYRTVRLALPYLIVIAVFEEDPDGVPRLSGRNECFFANEPLESAGVESKLCYPALLNCSRFPRDPRHSLAWVCTQHLGRAELQGEPDAAGSVRAGLAALLRHLFETGFNFSSEDHELSSWYSETVAAKVDPRIATVEAWEAASAEDPLFALEVPWLPTGLSLRQIVQRIVELHADLRPAATCARDLARIVFNGAESGGRA